MGKVIFKNILILILVVIFDQLSKKISVGSEFYHLNEGVMFGLMKDSSFFFRLTTLSSIFGFIFSLYLILLYLLNNQLAKLKIGMSLLVGGIFGNVIDKVIIGATVDFIPAGIFIFNLADVFQWGGALLIVFKVVYRDELIWYPENKRGKVLLFRGEQYRFSTKLTLAVISSSLLFGVFTFSFMQAILLENKISTSTYYTHFFISYLFLTLIFGAFVFIFGLFLSHRTAGPIYSFSSFVDSFVRGENVEKFTLREGDNYKELEKIASKITNFVKK